MNKLFVLICVAIMCSGCADLVDDIIDDASNKIEDKINDYDYGYEDNYCDGMTDDDGDGYYQKNIYNHGEIIEKLTFCNGDYIYLEYQKNSYDVLKVSNCEYARITEEDLLSDPGCELLEEVPEI